MLTALTIRNMALIDAVDIRLPGGLNVLTGETGAGKSILLDALGFALGRRGRADMVRSGASSGEVVAEFDLADAHPANNVLAEVGIPAGRELILRRTTTADGKRQAWINDRRVTVETLRNVSDKLVEIHGQHDERGLLDPRGYRELLDLYAGTAVLVSEIRDCWKGRAKAARELALAREELASAARDREYFENALEEVTRLDPQPDEDAALDTRRRQLRAAAKIRESVARAAEGLGASGLENALLQAFRLLEEAAPHAEGALDPALDGLGRILIELGDVTQVVERQVAELTTDSSEIETVEERLFALRALARKYNVPPGELGRLADEFRGKVETLHAADDRVAGLEKELEAQDAVYTELAARLTAARQAAAAALEAAMAEELGPLKLGAATFSAVVEAAEPGPEGADRVLFLVSTSKGAQPGAFDRIASGGELSRFLLALKVCLSAGEERSTLIFDEIDRGVGGATADAVGRRLQSLGAAAQVIVVTHSPQVAARGGSHWRIKKREAVAGQGVSVEVSLLDATGREEEIARMLAGDVVTLEARAAARALLDA